MGLLPFDHDLFHLLVCPVARCPLKWVGGRLIATDPASRRAYPVENGIPVMLSDRAEVLSEAAWAAAMAADGPVGGGPAALQS